MFLKSTIPWTAELKPIDPSKTSRTLSSLDRQFWDPYTPSQLKLLFFAAALLLGEQFYMLDSHFPSAHIKVLCEEGGGSSSFRKQKT